MTKVAQYYCFRIRFSLGDVAQRLRVSLRRSIMVLCARATASSFILVAVCLTSFVSLSRTAFCSGFVASFWCAFEASVLRFRVCVVALLNCLDLTFSLRSPSQLRVFRRLGLLLFVNLPLRGFVLLLVLFRMVFRRTCLQMFNPIGIC